MNETQVTQNPFTARNPKDVMPNREYRSSVFSLLYNDPRKLLDLYNAMNHSSYTDADKLEIVTLSNALYIGMKNDKAFLLDYWLNLYEHQSTPNPNMPLRHLFYVVREYARLVDMSRLYRSSPMRLPTPRFVVFYNGKKRQPERQVLKLSHLFVQAEEDPMLELKVEFLNINAGYNEELKERCESLKEYCLFIERIHRYMDKGMSLNLSVEQAVEECICEGILKDFLIANRGEVIAMSILEFTFEDWVKVMQEEQEEILQGRREIAQGRKEVALGREEVAHGREEVAQGRQEVAQGRQELLLSQEKLILDRAEIARAQDKLKQKQNELELKQSELNQKLNDLNHGKEKLRREFDLLEEKRSAALIQGREEGLKALVLALQPLLPDGEAVYQAIITNEDFADCTREKVLSYYQALIP